jgi:hypothetical protein
VQQRVSTDTSVQRAKLRSPVPSRGRAGGARDFRCSARRITHKDEVEDAPKEILASQGPYVLEVLVPYQEHVLPMIPSGDTVRDIIRAGEGGERGRRHPEGHGQIELARLCVKAVAINQLYQASRSSPDVGATLPERSKPLSIGVSGQVGRNVARLRGRAAFSHGGP